MTKISQEGWRGKFCWLHPQKKRPRWLDCICDLAWSILVWSVFFQVILRDWNGLSKFSISLSKYHRNLFYNHSQNAIKPRFMTILVFIKHYQQN